MSNEHKQRLEIDDSKIDIEIIPYYDEKFIRINLIFMDTGEIRQRDFSFSTVARRLFASHIKTVKKRYPKTPEYHVPIKKAEV